MNLNERQIMALNHYTGPLIIEAVPGSGKTRVLVERVKNLINNHNIDPRKILCFTFTNKSAKEMKDRLSDLEVKPTISTFHSLGYRLLKFYGNEDYTIIDDSDKKKILKELAKEMGLKKQEIDEIMSTYSLSINSLEPFSHKLVDSYEKYKKIHNYLDFDTILSESVKLLEEKPHLAKWDFISVDEFQDTCKIQLKFIELLTKNTKNILFVGDKLQSIYSWRSAMPDVFEKVQEMYSPVTKITLNQNYRSNKNIVDFCNKLFRNDIVNREEAITNNPLGERVKIKHIENSKYEFESEIKYFMNWIGRDLFNDTAILVRMRFQTYSLEKYCRKNGHNYTVYGGFPFYAREEIKNILCYIYLLNNPCDILSFERVISVPKRGFGPKKLEVIKEIHSENPDIPIIDILIEQFSDLKTVKTFIELYQELNTSMSVFDIIKMIIEKINYNEYMKKTYSDEDDNLEERDGNVMELLSISQRFENLDEMLLEIQLMTEPISEESAKNKLITIATCHSVKGLEFNNVYIPNMVNNIFPTFRSILANDISEEKRLFFVAASRAKKRLLITYPNFLSMYGKTERVQPSEFIK